MLSVVEGMVGDWFRQNMVQKLGDGKESSFWKGAWAGEKTMQ